MVGQSDWIEMNLGIPRLIVHGQCVHFRQNSFFKLLIPRRLGTWRNRIFIFIRHRIIQCKVVWDQCNLLYVCGVKHLVSWYLQFFGIQGYSPVSECEFCSVSSKLFLHSLEHPMQGLILWLRPLWHSLRVWCIAFGVLEPSIFWNPRQCRSAIFVSFEQVEFLCFLFNWSIQCKVWWYGWDHYDLLYVCGV